MIKQILSSFMVGLVRVDTIIDTSTFIPGEFVYGEVILYGGNKPKRIERIKHSLVKTYNFGNENIHYPFFSYEIVVGKEIAKDEERRIAFHFKLPENLPIPLYEKELWLKTDVEIPKTLDPEDKDYVQVKMHPFMESCMKTFQDELEFSANVREALMDKQIIKIDKKEFASVLNARQHMFLQSVRFKPTHIYKDKYERIEIFFDITTESIDLYMYVIFKSAFSKINSNPLNYVLLKLPKEISHDQSEVSKRLKHF
ncbi:sporulation protein [Fictibacillus sp. b24]|uniref:sporulation protein n=1 Tax=Fictibacillus sp. b24 TaxID=3055863 RepID=UPI0025A0C7FA|nr:sporulation protein [Fictibacillus sp. b24]MDM5317222.1 sporulation protein [Fictibacillus sp. b24]